MSDRVAIISVIDAIFDSVDAKDWPLAESLFTGTVDVDFTSLAGGDPATVTNVQLVDGWRAGLHPKKKSFHLVGHYVVDVDGDTATATVKGYAHNVLDADLGGGMWEVWGRYNLAFQRTDQGWKSTALAFFAQQSRGDEAVRTHTLG